MKLKNTTFLFLIFFVILQIMAMRQSDNDPVPIYNRIANKKLIAIIEDFIKRGEGTRMDSICKFLHVRTNPRDNESIYIINIRYMIPKEHSGFYKQPTIICAPIGGKKIFIDQGQYYDPFIEQNRPEVGLYFREDYPDIYKEFLETVKLDNERPKNNGPDMWDYDFRSLSVRFSEYGEFIDSTYYLYDEIF